MKEEKKRKTIWETNKQTAQHKEERERERERETLRNWEMDIWGSAAAAPFAIGSCYRRSVSVTVSVSQPVNELKSQERVCSADKVFNFSYSSIFLFFIFLE